jgi:hypothetical protein
VNVTPIQSDFSVGEIAPDVQYRSTLQARNRGVGTLTNMIADSHGPVIKRYGFRFLGKVGEAQDYTLVCGEGVSFAISETLGTGNTTSGFTMHSDNRIVLSKHGSGSNYGVIGTYDIDTDTWTKRDENPPPGLGGPRTSVRHFSGSGVGSVRQHTHIYYMLETRDGIGLSSTRLKCRKVSDWSTDPAVSSDYSSIGNDVEFLDESPNYIAVASQNNNNVSLRRKSNFGASSDQIVAPSGYTMGGCFWDDSTSSWLVVYYKNSTPREAGIAVVAADAVGDISGNQFPSGPTKMLTASGYFMALDRGSWLDGDGNRYFPFTSTAYQSALVPSPAHAGFIQKIDVDGDSVRVYSSDDTAGLDPQVFADTQVHNGQSAMTYDAGANRVLGSVNGDVLQHDLETDTWSTCNVAGVGSGTIGALLDSNDYMWGVDRNTFPITFWRHEVYE